MISSASYPTWRLETLFAERQMREGIVSLSRQCWASWKMLIVCWIRWKIYFFLNKRGLFDTFDLKNIYLTKVLITYVNRNILISYFSYILLYKEYWNSQKNIEILIEICRRLRISKIPFISVKKLFTVFIVCIFSNWLN